MSIASQSKVQLKSSPFLNVLAGLEKRGFFHNFAEILKGVDFNVILTTLDWIFIAAFMSITFGVGIYFAKRSSKDLESFFLGGRKIPWFVAGISMVATTFAADTPLAVTELVHQDGISGNWLWWNMLIGGMLTNFLFARLWRKAGVLTEVELITLRYSGKTAQFLRKFKAVYLGLVMNVLIIAWVNLAFLSILAVFFDLNQAQLFWVGGGVMFFVAIYSMTSGILGIAVNDNLQFLVAMTGSLGLVVFVLNAPEVGGLTGLKAQLPESTFSFFPVLFNDAEGMMQLSVGSFVAYMMVQWWASWYPGAEPGGGGYIVQRMMSTPSEKAAVKAGLLFQWAHYCLRPWPWILVAMATLILYPDLSDSRLAYVYAMRDYLPDGWRGLLLVGFTAAYMSTVSTQLNWGAGYLVNDFLLGLKGMKQEEAKRQLLWSRVATFLLAAIALYVTSIIESISGVWFFIVECGAGLGLVLILRWYWWRINVWSEVVAMVVPAVLYAFFYFYTDWVFPNRFFVIVGGTTLSWVLVTLLTAPESSQTLNRFFEKVHRKTADWSAVAPFEFAGIKTKNIAYLLLSWLLAVVFTYACLFAIGYLIFGATGHLYLAVSVLVVAIVLLAKVIKKTDLFD